MEPIYTFESHIAGKNANVAIFPDRIEWSKAGSKIARYSKATATVGLSLLSGKKNESEMVLMKQVTNVGIKRDGMRNSLVTVTTAGGVIGFRVSHKEAETVKQTILQNVG